MDTSLYTSIFIFIVADGITMMIFATLCYGILQPPPKTKPFKMTVPSIIFISFVFVLILHRDLTKRGTQHGGITKVYYTLSYKNRLNELCKSKLPSWYLREMMIFIFKLAASC